MFIDQLYVTNIPKTDAGLPLAWENGCARDQWLLIETCQRFIKIGDGRAQLGGDSRLPGASIFRGAAGYEFLLRLACGLESRLAGETEILGQLKTAWAAFEGRGSSLASGLRPWFEQLFTDSKKIRRQYMTGHGSATYASLARRLLDRDPNDTVLVFGAGSLAHSVIKLLQPNRVRVWNRTAAKVQQLQERLPAVEHVGCPELTTAVAGADHLVFCIPVDPMFERSLLPHVEQPKTILHFGGGIDVTPHWQHFPIFKHLDDVFKAEQETSLQVARQVKLAREACAARAREHAVADSLCNENGWEDIPMHF